MDTLAAFRSWFDPHFAAFLSSMTARLPAGRLAAIGERIRALGAGGKRLRPFIACAAFESGGGCVGTSLLPLLCALEAYHLFALIHDDIMDGASTRHGVPCIHTSFGASQAILAGDLCLSWAYESMHPYRAHAPCMALFDRLAQETVIGQMLDVSLPSMPRPTAAMLDERDDYKTARYSFTYPALLGVAASGSSRATEPFCALGLRLGHAYQRLDDLADLFWSESRLGKAPRGDLMSGIPTRVAIAIRDRGTDEVRSALAHLAEGTHDAARSLATIRHSAAYATETAAISNHLAAARMIVEAMDLPAHARIKWEAVIDLLAQKLDTR